MFVLLMAREGIHHNPTAMNPLNVVFELNQRRSSIVVFRCLDGDYLVMEDISSGTIPAPFSVRVCLPEYRQGLFGVALRLGLVLALRGRGGGWGGGGAWCSIGPRKCCRCFIFFLT